MKQPASTIRIHGQDQLRSKSREILATAEQLRTQTMSRADLVIEVEQVLYSNLKALTTVKRDHYPIVVRLFVLLPDVFFLSTSHCARPLTTMCPL